jgi:hypothetical protein
MSDIYEVERRSCNEVLKASLNNEPLGRSRWKSKYLVTSDEFQTGKLARPCRKRQMHP